MTVYLYDSSPYFHHICFSQKAYSFICVCLMCQRECDEWVGICQILLCDLMGHPLELQLTGKAVPKFITDLSFSVESVPSLVRSFIPSVQNIP